MPVDPTLAPDSTDHGRSSLQKINQLQFNRATAPDPSLAPDRTDGEHASLQKINQLVFDGATITPPTGVGEAPTDGKLYGRQSADWTEVIYPASDFNISAWQPITYQPGWSGNVQARTIRKGTSGPGIIQMFGTMSGTPWTSAVIVGNLPAGIWPGATRSLLIPSSQGSGVADGISSLLVSSSAAITLSMLVGTNQAAAFFDGVIFAI